MRPVTSWKFLRSCLWLPSQSHWKKLPRRLNLLNGSRQGSVRKNSAFCSVLQGNPAVASPNEELYEQMTSNPAFTERNIQKPNAYLLDSRPEQKSLVTYHTLQSVYVCVWLVNTLTSTASIGSPIICLWSPADTCEQWERNLSFGSADARGAGTRDEPVRTSAWEAICRPVEKSALRATFHLGHWSNRTSL